MSLVYVDRVPTVMKCIPIIQDYLKRAKRIEIDWTKALPTLPDHHILAFLFAVRYSGNGRKTIPKRYQNGRTLVDEKVMESVWDEIQQDSFWENINASNFNLWTTPLIQYPAPVWHRLLHRVKGMYYQRCLEAQANAELYAKLEDIWESAIN
jgi:hypothetical protein